MSVKVVDDLDEAISHVNRSPRALRGDHLLDIVSADQFAREVDAAAVLVRSTRFVDGEFGFGAEIGISTQNSTLAARWVST